MWLRILDRNLPLDYYRSIFVTLILTSGLPDPVFKKIYTFLQLKLITKTTLKI